MGQLGRGQEPWPVCRLQLSGQHVRVHVYVCTCVSVLGRVSDVSLYEVPLCFMASTCVCPLCDAPGAGALLSSPQQSQLHKRLSWTQPGLRAPPAGSLQNSQSGRGAHGRVWFSQDLSPTGNTSPALNTYLPQLLPSPKP